MSPTLSHSRLFKATRRFIVAEITLIIVIVVLFAWSTYVLFKLFGGENETLFGFSIGSQSLNTKSQQQALENVENKTGRLQQSQAQAANQPVDSPIASQLAPSLAPHQSQIYQPNGQTNLNEQLANYKNQILKELVARQQKLLSSDPNGRLASLLGIGSRNLNLRPVDVPHGDGAQDEAPIHEYDRRVKRPVQNSLIYLDDAPSLMQLSSKSRGFSESPDDDPLTTTTISPMSETEADQSDNLNEQTNQIATTVQPFSVSTLESPETTTIEPATNDDDHEESSISTTTTTTTALANPTDDDQQNSPGGDQEDSPDQNNAEDNPNDSDRTPSEPAEDEKRALNAVKTIDEEVDRMTQPSLGLASQQSMPVDQSSNGVQFDDVPLPLDQNQHEPPSRPTTSPTGLESMSQKLRIEPKSPKQAPVDSRRTSPTRRLDTNQLDNVDDLQDSDFRDKAPSSSTNSSNSKSAVQPSEIQPPNPESRSNSGRLNEAQQRTFLKRSRSKRAANEFDLGFSEQSQKPKRLGMRRSDDDNDEDSDTSGDDLDQTPDQLLMSPVAQYQRGPQQSEPTFEQLLAHKQLLDALQQSLPPAPVKLENFTLSSGPIATPTTPKVTTSTDDHQSADSHYTVDHGLLLYPASDEEHQHKSKSQKSHKASKKKDKKKLTVAMKKGGHKRKKHKKEEKKYHKEKKFKGAKKGKKMKKGKGGKGGKKGKKLFKDKGYKKKGFKNTYVKNEFGSKKSYFDEFRDKDFKKKWKNFDDKYNYAQMKKWQAKDVKKAKKMKDHGEKYKKYDKSKWKKQKFAEKSSGSKKSMAKHHKDF